jgi:hypothetical protein
MVWDESYTKASENNCISCNNFVFIAARLFMVFLLILLLIAFAVFTTMQDIHREITAKYLHLMGIFVGANY